MLDLGLTFSHEVAVGWGCGLVSGLHWLWGVHFRGLFGGCWQASVPLHRAASRMSNLREAREAEPTSEATVSII